MTNRQSFFPLFTPMHFAVLWCVVKVGDYHSLISMDSLSPAGRAKTGREHKINGGGWCSVRPECGKSSFVRMGTFATQVILSGV